MSKRIGTMLLLLTATVTIADAVAGTAMRYEEIVRIEVFAPSAMQLSSRGSQEDQRELIVRAPAIHAQVTDVQKISDFASLVSGRHLKCQEPEEPIDAVVRIHLSDGREMEYVVNGSEMRLLSENACHVVPDWIRRLIQI